MRTCTPQSDKEKNPVVQPAQIEEAENIENRKAGRKYDATESCIRDWHRKQNATYREE